MTDPLLEPAEPPDAEPEALEATGEEPDKKKKKKEKKGEFGSGRAVETLFKVLYRNHYELTSIADTKANIMVGINGLLTSVTLGRVLPELGHASLRPVLPALIVMLGCAVSLVCAILAARSRISTQMVSLADVRANRANILFFGHFSHLSSAEFADGMHDLMDEPKLLFDEMARDIHALGSVLTRKYRLLRASYTALLATVVLSVASALAVGALG